MARGSWRGKASPHGVMHLSGCAATDFQDQIQGCHFQGRQYQGMLWVRQLVQRLAGARMCSDWQAHHGMTQNVPQCCMSVTLGTQTNSG